MNSLAKSTEMSATYTATNGQEVSLTPEIVAKYIITGNGTASDKDMATFIGRCRARGLDPISGDAHMVVYTNHDGSTTANVIVSKDYFIRTATERPDFDGMDAGVVVINRQGEMEYREGSLCGNTTERLVGGWAKVYTKGRSHPSVAVVSLSEYSSGKSMWKSKPATMIRKVAVVQAIREAYPQIAAGVYDQAEMPEYQAPIEGECTQDAQEETYTYYYPIVNDGEGFNSVREPVRESVNVRQVSENMVAF